MRYIITVVIVTMVNLCRILISVPRIVRDAMTLVYITPPRQHREHKYGMKELMHQCYPFVDTFQERALLLSEAEDIVIEALITKHASRYIVPHMLNEREAFALSQVMNKNTKISEYAIRLGLVCLCKASYTSQEVDDDLYGLHLKMARTRKSKVLKKSSNIMYRLAAGDYDNVSKKDIIYYGYYQAIALDRFGCASVETGSTSVQSFPIGEDLITPYVSAGIYMLENKRWASNISAHYKKSDERINELTRSVEQGQRQIRKLQVKEEQVSFKESHLLHRISELEQLVNSKEEISVITMLRNDVMKLQFALEEAQSVAKEAMRDKTQCEEELIFLRSYKEYIDLLNSVPKDIVETEDTISINSIVGDRRVVVVGGHSVWRARIQRMLCEQGISHLMLPTELNRSLPKIFETDFVIINIVGISHSFYWKVCSRMEGNPLMVRVNSTSMAATLQQLIERTPHDGKRTSLSEI